MRTVLEARRRRAVQAVAAAYSSTVTTASMGAAVPLPMNAITTTAPMATAPHPSADAVTGTASPKPTSPAPQSFSPALGVHIAFEGLTLLTRGVSRLAGVSGDIRPGRITAIMGGSGAGKSSLVATLLGRERPTSGTVISTVRVVPSTPLQALGSRQVSDASEAPAVHLTGHGSASLRRPTSPSPPPGTSPSPHHATPGDVGSGHVALSRLRDVLGYVPQDDILLRELTVREVSSRHTALMCTHTTTSVRG